MGTIFAVASKLLGVYLSFVGLTYLISAFALGDGEPGPALSQALSAAIAFAFAFVLVFRTDGLADRVGVGSDGAPMGRLESEAALRTGIVLIGLFVFVTRVGPALIAVSWQLRGIEFDGFGGAPARILLEAVPLALAILFVFRAGRVVDWITREKTPAL